MEKIQIQERNEYSALKWGIILLIYGAIISIFFKVTTINLLKPDKFLNLGLLSLTGVAYISTFIVRIFVIIYIIKIAGKINRSKFVWAVFALIFPPVSLIIISFMDYKVNDQKSKNILEKLRLDYKSELAHIKATYDLNSEDLQKTEDELVEKYNLELQRQIENSSVKIEQIESEDSPLSEDNAVMHQINKCPACNADIKPDQEKCSECGISFI